MNGDGANDLVVSMLVGGLAVRLNDGQGQVRGRSCRSALPDWPRGFALADFNRDGRLDIAAVTRIRSAYADGCG